MRKKYKTLNETDNRRCYNITQQWIINLGNKGMCIVCSRRCGQWTDCWKDNNREYDNPTKNWKYKTKFKKQWMKNLYKN